MTEMRPDANSDEAGAESEYGNDTGFAAEATRTSDADGGPDGGTGDGGSADPDRTPTNLGEGPGDGGD